MLVVQSTVKIDTYNSDGFETSTADGFLAPSGHVSTGPVEGDKV